MNNKVDYRKIGIAIAGIIAIIFGLMRGSDLFPIPEKSTQTEQPITSDTSLNTLQNQLDTTSISE